MLTSINLTNKERYLVIMGFVTESNIKPIMEKISEINEFDNLKESEIANYIRKPIYLNVSTFGGSVYTGLALMGMIEMSKTKIITIGLGYIMSMGLYIFLSGHEKHVHKNATFMYHEISTHIFDKLEGIKQDIKETQRLQNMLDNVILSKTYITKEKLEEVKKLKQEWYIPADEAIKLAISEELI
ncbi:MAG: ATP-dependent Clp protease proteolytic subunit [Clostridiales bacterium]